MGIIVVMRALSSHSELRRGQNKKDGVRTYGPEPGLVIRVRTDLGLPPPVVDDGRGTLAGPSVAIVDGGSGTLDAYTAPVPALPGVPVPVVVGAA